MIPHNLPGKLDLQTIGQHFSIHIISYRYHPFYITDSPEGGIGQMTGLEVSKQKAYAGVEFDEEGNPIPTACEHTYFF